MKKILFALFSGFIAAGLSAQSVELFFNNQDTLYVDPGSTFTIHLRVQDFTAVGTLQLTLYWEETHISLVSQQLADLSGLVVNSNPGQLLAVWTDVGGLGETIADSSTILNLTFTAASSWPHTTPVTFGSTPLALELNQFDGNVLVPMHEIASPCVIIIRQCQTSVLLPKDSICHTEPVLTLTPVCQQCLSLIWNDTLAGPSFQVTEDGWVHVEAKGPWDCTAKDSIFIANYQPMAILIQRPCYNETNGVVQLMGLPPGLTSLTLNSHYIPYQILISNVGVGSNQFTATDSLGCTYEWAIQVPAVPRQLVNIGPDREVIKGRPLEIEANAVGGVPITDLDLQWSANVPTILPCINCPVIDFTPIEDTQIILSAETIEGCLSYDTLLLSISHQNLYFPNVFAPNTSGENAFFLISAAPTQQLDISVLEIFDRWGNLVFSKRDFSPNDQSAAWDGTSTGGDCPAGVYIWRAETKNTFRFSGDVTLLR